MKRIVLLLGFLLITSTSANAACQRVFGCVSPHDLSPTYSRVLSNATGSNFLGQVIAEKILENQIKKETDAKMDVKLKSYSITDLKNGKFKSLEISGKNIIIDGVALSALNLRTLCDFNYIQYDKLNKTVTFKEDFGISFATVMTESDLNKTMQASGYNDLITQINKIGRTYNVMGITSSYVKIRNNKFMYVIKIALPFVKNTQDIVITADLKVKDGVICLDNSKLQNDFFSVDMSKLAYALNYLNPLEFSLRILENKDTTLKVQNVSIIDNKINVNGTVTVLKDSVTER